MLPLFKNNLFSESEHYTIVSVISSAFHQSPKTEIINTEQAAESCCQSAMVKISKQLSKFGNAGHSCLIFILSGFFIQLPFGLILHYGFFGFYIKSTTTTMMLYSIISYPVGIVLYLFCSFLYFWVSYKNIVFDWYFATIFSIKNGYLIQILSKWHYFSYSIFISVRPWIKMDHQT